MLRAFQITLLASLGGVWSGSVPGQEAEGAQDPVDEFADELQANPEMVDPLLGMEIEALRRIIQEMDARIELLEDRVVALEGAGVGTQ